MQNSINFVKGPLLNFNDEEDNIKTVNQNKKNKTVEDKKNDIASLYRKVISTTSTAKKEPDDIRNPLTFYINRQIKKEKGKNKSKKLIEIENENNSKSNNSSLNESFFCQICKMTVNVPKIKHIHGIPHQLSNKNMENSGNQAEFHLKGDNIGYQLLVKQGWDEQSGLGSKEDGRLYPLRVNYKHDKMGIGIKEKSKIKQQPKDAKLLADSKADKLYNKLTYENKYSSLLISNNQDSYKGDSLTREEYSILKSMNQEFNNAIPNPSPTVSQLRKHQRMIETLELAKDKGFKINNNVSSSHTAHEKILNKGINKRNKKKDFKTKIQKEENSRLKLLEYLKN